MVVIREHLLKFGRLMKSMKLKTVKLLKTQFSRVMFGILKITYNNLCKT